MKKLLFFIALLPLFVNGQETFLKSMGTGSVLINNTSYTRGDISYKLQIHSTDTLIGLYYNYKGLVTFIMPSKCKTFYNIDVADTFRSALDVVHWCDTSLISASVSSLYDSIAALNDSVNSLRIAINAMPQTFSGVGNGGAPAIAVTVPIQFTEVVSVVPKSQDMIINGINPITFYIVILSPNIFVITFSTPPNAGSSNLQFSYTIR